jgi:hypothetical protein
MTRAESFESRSFRMGAILVCTGTILIALMLGLPYGICFFAGGLLSALNLSMLSRTINMALRRPANPKFRTAGAYILRLLLIPLGLYAIIRLFFFGVIAAIAGFAAFGCGIFIEGIAEVFRGKSG